MHMTLQNFYETDFPKFNANHFPENSLFLVYFLLSIGKLQHVKLTSQMMKRVHYFYQELSYI